MAGEPDGVDGNAGEPRPPAGQPVTGDPAGPAFARPETGEPTPAAASRPMFGAPEEHPWSGGWLPPASPPPPAPHWHVPGDGSAAGRRPRVGAIVLALAIGLAAGVGGTELVTRGGASHGTAVDINVDSRPLQGVSDTDAERVASELGPKVGTIIADLADKTHALGTGFVIANDGDHSYLLTNNHVVDANTGLHVVMANGRTLVAAVVGTDVVDDLAVVSVPDGHLPTATFGDSSQLKVGQGVVAIGSPLGNEGSVTRGVVSALHRTITAGGGTGSSQSETLQDVLQTDASINHGNSGGPLADLQGRVIGVNVAIAGDATSIGYSIPSVLAHRVALQLIDRKPVRHPFLGITYLTSIDAVESGRPFDGPGVLVDKVVDGGPAAKGGFKPGDILDRVGDTSLDNGQTLGGAIQRYGVGDSVVFSVRRGTSRVPITVTLVDRPSGQ